MLETCILRNCQAGNRDNVSPYYASFIRRRPYTLSDSKPIIPLIIVIAIAWQFVVCFLAAKTKRAGEYDRLIPAVAGRHVSWVVRCHQKEVL